MKATKFISVALSLILVVGCEKKLQVPAVTEWAEFQDQFFRVTFAYPKGWHVVVEPNKVILYSSPETMGKFFDATSDAKPGAQIVVASERDTLHDLTRFVNSFESDKKSEGFEIRSKQTITIDSATASEFQYAGRYDEKTTLTAIRAITWKDSMIYYVHYGGYNEYFHPYKFVYDSVIATLKLPKPIIRRKDVDPSVPTEMFVKYSDDVVEFMYPDNYTPVMEKPGKEVQHALRLKAPYRQDCFITFDVRPAKGLTLEKVVEQNTKNVKAAKQQTTVGGNAAVFVNETPIKNVNRRTYFVVKSDKFYRVIVTYYSPMTKDFLPAFEKTVASLRLK
ncbi:MAG: hypothetical protein HY562_09930 [Ignavibacteriales bacterium]|nr:hypothetical protein [Ignavibacteriales bacterium]